MYFGQDKLGTGSVFRVYVSNWELFRLVLSIKVGLKQYFQSDPG